MVVLARPETNAPSYRIGYEGAARLHATDLNSDVPSAAARATRGGSRDCEGRR